MLQATKASHIQPCQKLGSHSDTNNSNHRTDFPCVASHIHRPNRMVRVQKESFCFIFFSAVSADPEVWSGWGKTGFDQHLREHGLGGMFPGFSRQGSSNSNKGACQRRGRAAKSNVQCLTRSLSTTMTMTTATASTTKLLQQPRRRHDSFWSLRFQLRGLKILDPLWFLATLIW